MKYTILILALLSTIIHAATITWRPPSERADGMPMTVDEIAGYRIYYGGVGEYKNRIDINDNTAISYDAAIPNGSRAVMTTIDTDGRESVYSDDILIAGQLMRPAPITDLSVVKKGADYVASWAVPTMLENGEPFPDGVDITKCFLFVDLLWRQDVPCATQPSATFSLTPGEHLIGVEAEIKDSASDIVAVSERSSITFNTDDSQPPKPPEQIEHIPSPGYKVIITVTEQPIQ